MTEIEVKGKLFLFGKLNVFDQQYVLGKLATTLTELSDNKDKTSAFFIWQKGFAALGQAGFKELAMLLLSKVKHRQPISDGVSNVDTPIINSGSFQFEWIETDFLFFQELVMHAIEVNFNSFLATPNA